MAQTRLQDDIAASIRGASLARLTEGADAPESTATGYTLGVGDSLGGSLAGDGDWLAISLSTGDNVQITMSGGATGGVTDPYLFFYDTDGALISFDDDGGTGLEAQFEFVAPKSGTWYVAAWGLSDGYLGGSGTYTLTVADLGAPLADYTNDQIAAYLTTGFWQDGGNQPRAFDPGAGRGIAVDITSLTAAGQQYAIWALESWEDVSSLSFTFVDEDAGGTAQIFFDDADSGAYSYSTTIGGTILRSTINVSIAWIAPDLSNGQAVLNTYSYSTYVHEIGHALGLGHAGDYNGSADYGTTPESGDNHYLNDSWLHSVMSYMDPYSNTTDGLDYAVHLTPMQADIIAIQSLYGTPSGQRVGDTIYGAGSTAGGYLDLLEGLSGGVLWTLYDQGGTDRLDLGFVTADQVIDLRPGTVSDVLGLPNALTIDRDTVIEDVISGSGDDVITGNDADNRIAGGGGSDVIDGGAGQDSAFFSGAYASYVVTTSGGVTQVAGDDGTDVLRNIETLVFSDQSVALGQATAKLSVADQGVASGRWVSLISILAVTAGSGTVTAYELEDTTGANSIHVDGAGLVDAREGYVITADQLGGVWFQGEATLGDQTIRLRAFDDAAGWGAWEAFVLSTDNHVPETPDVSATVGRGGFVAVSDLVDYSDPDGDAAVSFEIMDPGGDRVFVQGVGQIDASGGYVLDATQLDTLYIEGDTTEGSQTLRLRAFDGSDWGDWSGVEVTTQDTVATVAVTDMSLSVGRWSSLGAAVTYADADGDPALAYRITDLSGTGVYISGVGDVDASAGYEITAQQLWSVWIRSDAEPGSRSLSLSAYDGSDWSGAATFTVTTANHLTVIDTARLTVGAGGSAPVIDALSIRDADGDAPTAFQVIDAVGADSLYLDGAALAATEAVELTPTQMQDLLVLGDTSDSDQFIFVRAHDGTDWGDWSSVLVETTGSGTAASGTAAIASAPPVEPLGADSVGLPDALHSPFSDAALHDTFLFV